jgi:hypothetical protein
MSATLYTCPKCQCAYIGNSRVKFCAHCGAPLTDQGVVKEGFGRRDLETLHAKGWAIFMAKMEGD